jgi:hypothetical protein
MLGTIAVAPRLSRLGQLHQRGHQTTLKELVVPLFPEVIEARVVTLLAAGVLSNESAQLYFGACPV